MFNTTSPIKVRPDGSYVVQHQGAPYHVASREADPAGLFDLDQVRAFAEAHPGLVEADGPSLAEIKARLKAQIEAQIPARRKEGFLFPPVTGIRYQADPGVSEAVNGVLTALGAGVPVSFPLRWRSGDNQRPSFPDAATFAAFAACLLQFVDGLFQSAWDAKDAIDAAATPEAAQAAFDAWSAG